MGRPAGRFAEVLRSTRRRRGVTQRDLAERLGVDQSTVSNWERRIYLPPNITVVRQLAHELEVDAVQLEQAYEQDIHTVPVPAADWVAAIARLKPEQVEALQIVVTAMLADNERDP